MEIRLSDLVLSNFLTSPMPDPLFKYQMDTSLIQRQLRVVIGKQNKGSSCGRCPADHIHWSNAFLAGHGF